MTEQNRHLHIGHILDMTGQITAKRRICRGNPHVAHNGICDGQWQMFGVIADQQRPCAGFRPPYVGRNVEMTEGVTVERNGDLLAFMRVKPHFDETLEFAIRTQHASLRSAHVELCNGCTGDIGIVGDGERHTIIVRAEIGEREIAVAQTITERETHWNIGGLVIAVTDKRTLAVDCITSDRRIPAGARAITVYERPCFGQVTGRIDLAGKCTHGRRGSCLSGKADIQYGDNVIHPGQFDRRTGDEHHHNRLARSL